MNSLKAYKHLIAQGIPENEAEAQVEVMEDVLTNIVTKDYLRTSLSEFKLDMFKWTLTLSTAQFTIMLGVIYFMLSMMRVK